MLYIYNWDGSEPSISLQDVRSRWSGIADALHACANRGWQGSVDTEGPEQAAPYPVLSPAQPLFHAGRNMGAVGSVHGTKRACSAVASGDTWTPASVYNYYSLEAKEKQGRHAATGGGGHSHAARNSPDAAPCASRIDEVRYAPAGRCHGARCYAACRQQVLPEWQ